MADDEQDPIPSDAGDDPPGTEVPPLDVEQQRQLLERVGEIERRLDLMEQHERSELGHDGPLAVLPRMDGSPGFVTDEGLARATPCTRVDLGGGSELVFSKGVVGALDPKQKALYCPQVVEKPASPAQRKRLAAFVEASQLCSAEVAPIPKGERMGPWWACISREARERGEEV